MIYGKIENGKFKRVYIKFNPIWLDGKMHSNPSQEIIKLYKENLLLQGIKPVEVVDMPNIIDGYQPIPVYNDLGKYILQTWDLMPMESVGIQGE